MLLVHRDLPEVRNQGRVVLLACCDVSTTDVRLVVSSCTTCNGLQYRESIIMIIALFIVEMSRFCVFELYIYLGLNYVINPFSLCALN